MVDDTVDAGAELLALARASGAHSFAVVGTGKNAGKTTTLLAMLDALERRGETYAVCSIGRDGEAVDALGAHRKPALVLAPGAYAATARALVPRSPAVEILAIDEERSALGEIVLLRARRRVALELAGPPSAAAVRAIVARLGELVRAHEPNAFVAIDGAIDRLAALRGGDDAIVVAGGASGGATVTAAIESVRVLAARLAIPVVDRARERIVVEGALTAARASAFERAGERRQIAVRDATHLAMPGSALIAFLRTLDLRCERSLAPIACAVASQSAERRFDPRVLRRGVAAATGLPTFDVVASARSRVFAA